MVNTVRTQAELLALYADNNTGQISPQDGRDLIASVFARAYDLRSDFVTADPNMDDGQVVSAGGVQYVASSGAIAISGLLGWLPFGTSAVFSQFGAVGDAVIAADGTLTSGTDDTTAMQAAVDWQQAVAGRKLLGDEGAIYLTTVAISGSGEDVDIDFRGARIFKNATGKILDFLPAAITYFDLSADYTEGGLTIPVLTTGTALTTGTLVYVLSNAVDPRNRDSGNGTDQYRVAERCFAADGTTTTSIALKAPLKRVVGITEANDSQGIVTSGSFISTRVYKILTVGTTDFTLIGAASNTVGLEFTATGVGTGTGTGTSDEARVPSFSTAQGARIAVPTIKNMNLRNLNLQYASGHGQGSGDIWKGQAVVAWGYTGVISNVHQARGYSASIALPGCVNMWVQSCEGVNLENNSGDGQFGYGVADYGIGTVVINCVWNNVRHGYTSSSLVLAANEESKDVLGSAGAYGCNVSFNKAFNTGVTAGFDTHHDADSITFTSNLSDGSESIAVAIRGRNIKYVDHVIRRARGVGYKVFTDDNDTGGADDRFLAGKTVADFTSATIINPDIECEGVPIDLDWASLAVSGWAEIKSAGHKLIDVKGGDVIWAAATKFQTTTLEGAWNLTAANGDGVFNLVDPGSNPAALVFPSSVVTVRKGADITCDVEATSSTTPLGVSAQSSNGAFINRGRINFTLPSDGQLFGSTGTISTQSDGLFQFELDGVSDDATAHNLRGRSVNVQSDDGTVYWYAPLPQGGLSQVHIDKTVTAIVGTGSEIANAYVPPLSEIVKHMGSLGRGSIDQQFIFEKVGSTGTSIIKWDSFGSFLDQITTATDTTFIKCNVEIIITSTTEYTVNIWWEFSSNADTAWTTNARVLKKTEAGGIENASGTIIDLDPTIAVGDTINLVSKAIWASDGGDQ